MKVEFSVEEVEVMAQFVVERLLALEGLGKADKAALRRWRTAELRAAATTMQLLAERVNGDLQREHDAAQAPRIVKPDWL